jgi:hypothetical protein
MRGISLLAEKKSASQERLCSMYSVITSTHDSKQYIFHHFHRKSLFLKGCNVCFWIHKSVTRLNNRYIMFVQHVLPTALQQYMHLHTILNFNLPDPFLFYCQPVYSFFGQLPSTLVQSCSGNWRNQKYLHTLLCSSTFQYHTSQDCNLNTNCHEHLKSYTSTSVHKYLLRHRIIHNCQSQMANALKLCTLMPIMYINAHYVH